MRASTAVLVAMLAALAVTPSLVAQASCVGPMLEAVGELVRGEIGVVRGSYFINGCQDTMTCTEWLGCSRCRHDEPRPQPFGDLELRLMQDGSVWDLGVAEGHDGSPVWSVRVPEGAEPGAARLLVDHAEPLEVRIR